MTSDAQKRSGTNRDVIVYVCLLVLAAIQFFMAYQNISAKQMFARMLAVAVVEAAIALLFFMHLSENRGLLWFVVIFTIFVLLGLQFSWTDSFRLSGGVPWSRIG